MKKTQSKSFQLGTYEVNKIALRCIYDKWYTLGGMIKTLAFGHIHINYLIRTNFRAFAQKIHLHAKNSTESTLKKAMREI